jgi:beta-carotene 3-hydroxylase
MINAHYIHHSKHSKENGEAFGFLIVPKKYQVTNKHDKKDSPVDTFK